MPERETSFAVFIDYDNLLPTQKASGILDLVTKALIQIPMDYPVTRVKCNVRVYGGWYEGIQISRLAQDISVAIQKDFPAIIRLPTQMNAIIAILVQTELAVALLEEPSHHLFNTYRRKGSPSNIRIEDPAVVGCSDKSCILPLMRKLLKTGKCPMERCNVAVGDLVYRDEQKIVDTMLSCDLIYAASKGYDRIILVSGDDDFLPPLRTVLLRGTAAIRFHPKPNFQRASFPNSGAQFFEMDL